MNLETCRSAHQAALLLHFLSKLCLSVILTTNLSFSEWATVFGDALTVARITKSRRLGARWPATFPHRFQRLLTIKQGKFLSTTNEI